MKKRLFTTIFIVCMAGVISLIFLYKNRIFADQLHGDTISRQSITADLDLDNKTEKVTVATYRSNNKNVSEIRISKSIFNEQSISLSGFEDNVKFCDQDIIRLSESDTYVCIVGDVGVHSQNIQLARYKDGKITFAKFINGPTGSENITTDEPKFNIDTSVSPVEFSIDNRNYDFDPVRNGVRSSYKYSNGLFTFTGSKDIVYSEVP